MVEGTSAKRIVSSGDAIPISISIEQTPQLVALQAQSNQLPFSFSLQHVTFLNLRPIIAFGGRRGKGRYRILSSEFWVLNWKGVLALLANVTA